MCTDVDIFYNFLIKNFSNQTSFSIAKVVVRNVPSIVAHFECDGFPIEIFGQNCPSHLQNAYLHMLAESIVLKEKGEAFRQKIIQLKRMGYKTEPAFAKALNLSGDAYDAVLSLL